MGTCYTSRAFPLHSALPVFPLNLPLNGRRTFRGLLQGRSAANFQQTYGYAQRSRFFDSVTILAVRLLVTPNFMGHQQHGYSLQMRPHIGRHEALRLCSCSRASVWWDHF